MTEKLRSVTTTTELVRTISENSNILDMKISDKCVVDIENQGNYFEYLRLFCEKELDIGSKAWLHPIPELAYYIYESEKWYIFLEALYNKFSEYEVQRDKNKYNVENLEDWGKDEKPQEIQISADTFHQFLSKIEVFNIMEYESIKDITATELRVEELNHVLCLTLKHKINIIYKEPYILIKGDYIRMEDFSTNRKAEMDLNDIQKKLLTLLQSGRYKFLNVFALKTLFIDSDATFPGIGMRFFAPKWEIIGTRNINLNGICGEPHLDERPNTVQRGGDSGKDGEPGNPGRPGGSFFGIGEHFVKGCNLTVTVNGGDGSAGQHGEHGKYGLDGTYARLPEGADNTNHADLRKGITSINGFQYKIFGEPGKKGGDGGNGGRGGKGGHPGIIKIIELGDSSEISMHANPGKDGVDGQGGDGGTGGDEGGGIHAGVYIETLDYVAALYGIQKKQDGNLSINIYLTLITKHLVEKMAFLVRMIKEPKTQNQEELFARLIISQMNMQAT
ncbi:uncharacterized protein CEXT_636871 [Caerostris extrusa]|uniref:Collagen-like protein n=1 Tax=Caerostris extrusa TaxID=172846 RepID=A0AAV4MA07_CAEEX|nr:uncharacterized protein CEXT_636871 [Caerostris extrusa]